HLSQAGEAKPSGSEAGDNHGRKVVTGKERRTQLGAVRSGLSHGPAVGEGSAAVGEVCARSYGFKRGLVQLRAGAVAVVAREARRRCARTGGEAGAHEPGNAA